MAKAGKGKSATEMAAQKDVTVEQKIGELSAMIDAMRGELDKVLQRININDQRVEVPEKRNYNPDRLPRNGGQEPISYHDLPPVNEG